MSPIDQERGWLRGVEVQRLMRVSEKVLGRLVEEGKISIVRNAAIRRTLYSRADVEALMAPSTRPARADVQELAEAGGPGLAGAGGAR